jgi:dTDP-4-dehydrorhamnose reductase
VKSIAIIGPNGQLGSDLVKHFTKVGWSVTPAPHSVISVENNHSVENFISSSRFDVVVNTAALHQVGICEKEISRSWQINAMGAENVAKASRAIGAQVIYISTDYVFDGELPSGESYEDNSSVSPINVYGASKAAGEVATLSASDSNLVVRIASVFGVAGSSGKGGNFIETIINKAKSGEVLKVVDDIEMSPSYTLDIAEKIEGLLESKSSGVFHCNNSGSVTWNGFAQEILNQLGMEFNVEKSKTDWSLSPKRPRNSSLKTLAISQLGIRQKTWQDALNSYLIEKKHLS